MRRIRSPDPALAARRKLEWFLVDMCNDLGFCVALARKERFLDQASWSAGDFAAAVLREEGLSPERERQWMREISNRFVKRFEGTVWLSKPKL